MQRFSSFATIPRRRFEVVIHLSAKFHLIAAAFPPDDSKCKPAFKLTIEPALKRKPANTPTKSV